MKNKKDFLYVNNLGTIAKFSLIKWKILIDRKYKKILNKKEMDCLKDHERFHKKFNIFFVIPLIFLQLFLAYKLGILGFVLNLFTFIKMILIIILFIPLTARIIEISADLYSSYKNGKGNMVSLIKKVKPKADLLHPNAKTRLFFIKFLS